MRSLTNYYDRQNSWLEENKFNLLPNKIELDSEKQRKEFKHFPQPIPFSSSSALILHSWLLYLPLVWAAEGWWGIECCGQFTTFQCYPSFLLTLFPSPSMCPLLDPQLLQEVSTCFGVGTPMVCSVDIHADVVLSMAYSSTSFPYFTSQLDACRAISFRLCVGFLLFVCLCLSFPLTSPAWAAFCFFSNTFSQRHHRLS